MVTIAMNFVFTTAVSLQIIVTFSKTLMFSCQVCNDCFFQVLNPLGVVQRWRHQRRMIQRAKVGGCRFRFLFCVDIVTPTTFVGADSAKITSTNFRTKIT